MSNPLWKAGMKAVNPAGRPKYSVTTPAGMIERFVKRHISPILLKRLFDKLTASQKADFLLQLLPYIMPKKQSDTLTASDIDALYAKLEEHVNNQTNAKAS